MYKLAEKPTHKFVRFLVKGGYNFKIRGLKILNLEIKIRYEKIENWKRKRKFFYASDLILEKKYWSPDFRWILEKRRELPLHGPLNE